MTDPWAWPGILDRLPVEASHVMASASGLDLDLSEKEVDNPVVTRAAWVENAQRPSLRREYETQHQSEDSKE